MPISARLIEGEPLTVQSVKVDMRGRSLRWLLGKIDQRRVYYLSGEIQTARVEPVANLDLYQPVAYSSQTMTLRYARAQELGPWLELVAAKGEVFVQFWLRPGEQPVYFDLGNDPPADPIPGELRRFLQGGGRGGDAGGGGGTARGADTGVVELRIATRCEQFRIYRHACTFTIGEHG